MSENKSYPIVDKLLDELRLEDYNKMAQERSSEELFSVGRITTMPLLQTLFNNYNKSAKIFGTSLCGKILSDENCRKKLDMFESPSKILLTNFPNYEGEKIKNYFFNNMNNNVLIKEMKSFATSQFPKGEKEVEFLVLNDIAYFFEHNLNSNVTSGKAARCSFNNPDGALHLSKIFDEFYNKQ